MQINRVTGKARPLRISGTPAVVHGADEDGDDDDDDDDDEEEEEEDNPHLPVELRCPITQMVMKKPVMATDGHSYELKAMQKWLLKKQTSPVTGKPLANTTLVINQNLKKLIRDFASPIRGAWPATTAAAGPKRKAPIDEDLFGADDDDDDDEEGSPV